MKRFIICLFLILLFLAPQVAPTYAAPFIKSDVQSPTLIRQVALLADLQATSVTSATIKAVHVAGRLATGDGYSGTFYPLTGNQSANADVVADPLQGIYVKPSSPGDGSTGVWVRQYTNLYPEYFGVVLNSVPDVASNTVSFQAANDYAFAQGRTLYLADANYEVTSTVGNYALTISAPIQGSSTGKSVIHNNGAGSAVLIQGAPYYTRWANFSVSGNASSQHGIVTNNTGVSQETAYSTFTAVDSYGHGGHGLIQRYSWATRWIDCKFHDNGGLGIFVNAEPTDTAVANGVTFINCESRRNGGTAATTTFTDDKGGVKIVGAADVSFIGGVYEANNAWNFIISDQTAQGTTNVHLENLYMEACPNGATVGGMIYAAGIWNELSVEKSWIAYGANGVGETGYGFNINRTANSQIFTESQNTLTAFGSGTAIKFRGWTLEAGHTFSNQGTLGDIANTGVAVTHTIITVTDDGTYMLSGVIEVTRHGTTQTGLYPFMAQRNITGRSVAVGASIVTAASAAPTAAWVGDDLQITFPGNEYGRVIINEHGSAYGDEPTTVNYGPDFLEKDRMRRH